MKQKLLSLLIGQIGMVLSLSASPFPDFHSQPAIMAVANNNLIIDASIKESAAFYTFANLHPDTLHIFSHGRPGELLLDGEWKDATHIAILLTSYIKNYKHVNIYGCEFAKGNKGAAAVAYLQKALPISISASDDITGKDGDWELEAGTYETVKGLGNYAGNLQIGPADDWDGDGIVNSIDLDDDNDGILDTVEDNCSILMPDKTTITISKPANISYTGSVVSLIDGTGGNATAILNPSGTLNNNEWFRVEFPSPKVLIYWEIGHYSGQRLFSATSTYRVEGSSDGTTWIDLTGTLTYVNNQTGMNGNSNSNIANFSSNNTAYKYYRYFGITGSAGGGWAAEAYFQERRCAADIDFDGIANKFDLDSDGDGCADAIEGGAGFNSSQLITSSINGGNAGTSYRGYAGPLQRNLGNIVDANGIPTIAGGGQTMGISQNRPGDIDRDGIGNTCDPVDSRPDSDGDGIKDYIDLDDDNDGILDSAEGNCNPNVNYNSTAANGISNMFSQYGIAGSGTLYTQLAGNIGLIFSSSADFSSGITMGNACGEPAVQGANWNDFIWIKSVNPANITQPVPLYSISFKNDCQASTSTPEYLRYTAYDKFGDSLYAYNIATDPAIVQNSNNRFDLVMDPNYDVYSIKISRQSNAAVLIGVVLSGNVICNLSVDTDGDGIPDHLDLDSDADGCPDAMEGDENVTSAQLQTASGIMGTQSVNLNLGTTVDAKGVPTVVNSSGAADIGGDQGQGIGGSQSAGVNSCGTIYGIDDINQAPEGVTVTGSVLTNDKFTGTASVKSATYLNAAGVQTPLPVGTATNIYATSGVLAGSMTLNANGTYSFIPNPGFVGTVPVIYTLLSNTGATDNASLSIEVIKTVDPVNNNDPVAQNDVAQTEAGTSLSSNVLVNDSDPDAGTLTVSAASVPVGAATQLSGVSTTGAPVANAGTLTLNANGSYTFVPAPGFTGAISPVTYTLSDNNGGTDTAKLNIAVYPNSGNNTYTSDDAKAAPKGTTLTGNVKLNDTDPEGNPTTITGATVGGTAISVDIPTSIPGAGTLTLNSDGTYIFVPLPAYVGTINVVYTLCDNGTPQACSQSTLYLTSLNTSIPLSVTLLEFDATIKGSAVRLSWKTVKEQNNKGFELERSAEGRNWKKIGAVDSKASGGNSVDLLEYTFDDPDPLNSNNFYRLKQLDLYGNYEYSPVRLVTFLTASSISVYPNPTHHSVTISGLSGGEVSVQVLDISGRMISLVTHKDVTELKIATDFLSEGVYQLKIITGNQTYIRKIVKD